MLKFFDNSINFLDEIENISIGGRDKEIQYDPIDITNHRIFELKF